MNFQNIEKFLKKNYKKIIIVCLILFLLSNKMYENFTPTEALDMVKGIQVTVNSIFSKIDNSQATMSKKLNMNNNIILNDKQIRLRGGNDENHIITINGDVDGPEIKGNKGISLATNEGGAKRVVEIKKDDVKIDANLSAKTIKSGGKICINDVCMNEPELKRLLILARKQKHHFFIRNKDGKYLNHKGGFHHPNMGSDERLQLRFQGDI